MKDRNKPDKSNNPDANPDPITGAPGSHPIGTGVGAAGGGVAGAAAGAAIGAMASGPAAPVGGAIGAVIGAVAGGLAGKGAAEAVNPTAEDAYWRENYRTRPYYQAGTDYEDFRPAYKYGWESHGRYYGKSFDESEADLRRDWEKDPACKNLTWDRARSAARDACDRVERAIPGDADRDGK